MADRTLLILIIVLSFLIAVTYDQYVRDQGQVSPISSFLDFAGLSKLQDWRHSMVTKHKEESYHVDLITECNSLEDLYRRITEQRIILVEHRRDFLEQLNRMNKEFGKDIAQYAALLNQERFKIKEKWPELKSSFVKAQANTEDLRQLVKALDYEYIFLSQNAQATETDLHKNHQQIHMRFKDVTVKMNAVTEKDLGDLTDLYFQLRARQKELLSNLNQHYKRLMEKHEASREQIKNIFDSLKQFSKIDFVPLQNSADHMLAQRQEVWAQFGANENKLFDFIHQIRSEDENFIYRVADSIHVNLDEFLQKQEEIADEHARWLQSQEKLQRSVPSGHGVNPSRAVPTIDHQQWKVQQRSQPESLRPAIVPSGQKIDLSEQNRRVRDLEQDAKEKMDQMRDKAKNNGYYD